MRILYTPMHILLVIIVIFAVIGTYLNSGLTLTLLFLVAFGVIGYFMRSYDFPLAPVILGVVLGGNMEQSFRQSMSMSRGDLYIFLDHPIVVAFLILSLLFLTLPVWLRSRGAPRTLVDDDE